MSRRKRLKAPSESPRNVQQFANSGKFLNYFELRRLVSAHEGNVNVVFIRDDKTHLAKRVDGVITGDEKLFEKIPWYQYKFFWFRRLENMDSHMGCTH